jgi:DeoR/GlpR family transcriptional regulator of sugar metabolism
LTIFKKYLFYKDSMLNLLNRTIVILDILAARKTAKVAELIEALNVSHVTLRKDLDKLEKRGIIKCTHGYASLNSANNIGKRIAFNYQLKRKIAKAAAQIIEDGETVMIGSGSCCAIFAEELAFTRKNITVITNSLFIANFINDFNNIKIILLGGYFQPASQVTIGPVAISCVQHFHSSKYFLGTDGFIKGEGFTDRDHLRVETAMGLAKNAENVFILTEAAKFKCRGTCSLIQYDKISGVFTDDSIPKEAEADLLKNNVNLYKVSLAEERLVWRKFPELPPILFKEKIENHFSGGFMNQFAVDANALAKTFGKNRFIGHVKQLIFQRRRTCVDYKNFHI